MTEHRSQGARGPAAEDKILGARIRARRLALGLTQKDLAEALGVTFQQFQKYERGANRISALAMYRLSTVLQFPLDRIYDGVAPGVAAAADGGDANVVTLSTVENGGSASDPDQQRDLEALVAICGQLTKNERAAVLDVASNFLRDTKAHAAG